MDKKTLNLLIGKMKKKKLLELISQMTLYSSGAEEILLDYCKNDKMVENKNIVFEMQLQNLWDAAYSIIDDANSYGGCHYEEEEFACDEIYEMQSLIAKYEISWEVRKDILDKMLEQIIYDNSGFTDILLETTDELCQTDNEYLYLADLLSKHNGSYYRKIAASIYREKGNNIKFLEIQKENLVYGSDYVELAKYYQKNGENDKALEIVWKGFDKCEGRLDEIYHYLFKYYEKKGDEKTIWKIYSKGQKKQYSLDYITELMYDYSKKQNDNSNQKKMLLKLVNVSSSNDIEKWYKKCKVELSTTEWAKNKAEILKKVKHKNISSYLDICLENGNTKEVLEYIKKHSNHFSFGSIDSGHKYSKELVKNYPNEILKLYWKEVSMFVNKGKRKNYHHATTVLKEIRNIMIKNKQKDKWELMYNEFKTEHQRKRLLMEAIKERL